MCGQGCQFYSPRDATRCDPGRGRPGPIGTICRHDRGAGQPTTYRLSGLLFLLWWMFGDLRRCRCPRVSRYTNKSADMPLREIGQAQHRPVSCFCCSRLPMEERARAVAADGEIRSDIGRGDGLVYAARKVASLARRSYKLCILRGNVTHKAASGLLYVCFTGWMTL